MLSLRQSIYRDYRRYRAEGSQSWFDVVFFNHGFTALWVYRVCHWATRRARNPLARKIAGVSSALARTLTETVCGIGLPPQCEIGEGLCIYHFGPTVLNGRVRIGNHCSLRQGVTLGVAGRGENRGAPTIGDRVDIGANAIVIGRITVGDDAAIGAGAVVTKSVPARAVVAGNPARVLSYRGSFDFIRYDGMEHDPARVAALNDEAQDRESERRNGALTLEIA